MDAGTSNLLITAGVGLLGTMIGAGAGLLGGRWEFNRQVKRQEAIKKQERYDAAMMESRDACLEYLTSARKQVTHVGTYVFSVIKYPDKDINLWTLDDKIQPTAWMEYQAKSSSSLDKNMHTAILCAPAHKYLVDIRTVFLDIEELLIDLKNSLAREDIYISDIVEPICDSINKFEQFIAIYFKDYLVSQPFPVQKISKNLHTAEKHQKKKNII